MADRFDASARRALFLAKAHAASAGAAHIEPQHILAGLLRDRDAATLSILRALNVDTAALERECEATSPLSPQRDNGPFFSTSARRISALASVVAGETQASMADSCCLLLAILREPDNSAAKLLRHHGVAYSAALDAVRQTRENR